MGGSAEKNQSKKLVRFQTRPYKSGLHLKLGPPKSGVTLKTGFSKSGSYELIIPKQIAPRAWKKKFFAHETQKNFGGPQGESVMALLAIFRSVKT